MIYCFILHVIYHFSPLLLRLHLSSTGTPTKSRFRTPSVSDMCSRNPVSACFCETRNQTCRRLRCTTSERTLLLACMTQHRRPRPPAKCLPGTSGRSKQSSVRFLPNTWFQWWNCPTVATIILTADHQDIIQRTLYYSSTYS